MDIHRNIFLCPFVNPFRILEIYVDTPMAGDVSKIIVPRRVVDIDVRADAQIVFDESEVIIVRIIRPVAPAVMHLPDFFEN